MRPVRGSGTILVVDDDRSFVQVVSMVLRDAGFATVEATSGADAIPLLDEHAPDLVILDIRMPRVDGLQVLERIREKNPVPVIMLTALDNSENALRALRLGADDYLTKPVEEGMLLDRVARALRDDAVQGPRRRIANYELRREIGHGGMGTVYEAHDLTLDRPVALKVLQAEIAADPFYELLFLREARAVARLTHPGIVTVYQAGRHRGRLFMAMELVRGRTLAHELDSGRRFEPSEAAGILVKLAEAMDCAHEAGFVHGDIKPSNIILTPDSGVRVLDFGLTRIAREAHPTSPEAGFMGTLPYVAPEQIERNVVDFRSDIFSLGVLAYELLSGERPFAGPDPESVCRAITEGRVGMSLSNLCFAGPALVSLVESMVRTDPRERPESMRQVAELIGNRP